MLSWRRSSLELESSILTEFMEDRLDDLGELMKPPVWEPEVVPLCAERGVRRPGMHVDILRRAEVGPSPKSRCWLDGADWMEREAGW